MRTRCLLLLFFLLLTGMIYSCQQESAIEFAKYMSNGKDIYQMKCQNCHGNKGEGLGKLAPPLTDSLFLKEHQSLLACIIKHGSQQGLVVHGIPYEDKMPPFPEMEAIDIAQVVVYIRNSFGNQLGMYSYEQVLEDLKNCK